MRIYFKVVWLFFVLFFLIFCSDSTKNHYPTPEKSDAPEQCKTPTKPFVVKIFYDGNVVLNSGIDIENATVTFQKNARMLEIEGILWGYSEFVIEKGEGKEVIIHYYGDPPQKIKLLLQIDFINPEYLEKVTGQNLFVYIIVEETDYFFECVGSWEDCETLVPDTLEYFVYEIVISKKPIKWIPKGDELDDILLLVYSGDYYSAHYLAPWILGNIIDLGCPFLLWRKSWVFNDFCCLLFEGASKCRCISSGWPKEICGCGNEVDAVGKRIAVKFGESVIWPGQTVKVDKFVVGVADATRFKFGGKKIETLWDFISLYMVRVE